MSGIRFFSSIALVGGALVACSGGGGSTGTTGGGGDFASQYCQIYAQCCGKAGYPTDGVTCTNFVNQSAANREYNAARGEECLAGFRVESQKADFCENGKTPLACSEVYKAAGGGVPAGSACKDDADCAASPEGDVDCASISSSGATTRICQVRLRAKEGEACIGTKDGSTTITSGSGGVNGAPPPAKIGICFTEDNLHCEGSSVGTGGDQRKCARIQDVGGPCTSSSSYACVKAAYCDTSKKLCTARVGLGGDCGASFASNVCQDKLSCDSTTKKCIQGLPDGAACEKNDQCESDSCVNKKCEKASGFAELGYLLICGPKSGG